MKKLLNITYRIKKKKLGLIFIILLSFVNMSYSYNYKGDNGNDFFFDDDFFLNESSDKSSDEISIDLNDFGNNNNILLNDEELYIPNPYPDAPVSVPISNGVFILVIMSGIYLLYNVIRFKKKGIKNKCFE